MTEFEGTATKKVKFDFEQGSDEFKGYANGAVKFIAAVGVGAEEFVTDTTGNAGSDVGFTSCNNPCSNSATTTQNLAVQSDFLAIQSIEDKQDNNLDDSGDDNNLTQEEHEALEGKLAEVNINIVDIDITVLNVGLDRYYVAHPKKGKRYKKHNRGRKRGRSKKGYYENEIACFRQYGPGSSIFPGLISLIEISFDDIPIDVFVGLPEIADGDVDDDTDDDSDSDDDDGGDSTDDGSDSGDDGQDSGDGTDGNGDSLEDAPIFQGLPGF